MRMRKPLLMMLLLPFGALAACMWSLPDDCRQFFDMPAERQKEEFKGYPIEKQVRVYICGMRLEPPQIMLASDIAAGGPDNIPYLLGRLKSEPNEGNKADIIYIFAMLAAHGHLKGRQDIVDEIEHAVSSIKEPGYRDKAEQSLKAIKQLL
jgi:hypothetical protein